MRFQDIHIWEVKKWEKIYVCVCVTRNRHMYIFDSSATTIFPSSSIHTFPLSRFVNGPSCSPAMPTTSPTLTSDLGGCFTHWSPLIPPDPIAVSAPPRTPRPFFMAPDFFLATPFFKVTCSRWALNYFLSHGHSHPGLEKRPKFIKKCIKVDKLDGLSIVLAGVQSRR